MRKSIVAPALTTVTSTVMLAACGLLSPSATQPRPVAFSATIEATYWATRAPQPANTVATIASINQPTATATVLAPTTTEPPVPTETPLPPTETPVPTLIPTLAENTAMGALRTEMLNLHNSARALHGLPPFITNPQLQQAAQEQAEWLAQKPVSELWSLGPRAHIGANNSTYQQRIAATGYPASRSRVNENFGTFGTAHEAFDWWMNDPDGALTHRPNILSAQYREIGIGVVPHSSGLSTVFIITFGAP